VSGVVADAIFHIAEKVHWEEALASGRYRWSTLGRTLEDEGFIHASEAHQWAATLERFYAGHEGDLVLLTIDPTRLTAPLVREVGNPATGEEFPHIYGPVDTEAVVAVRPIAPPVRA
jgi:uncharacterized protein (DUF952 family)